jgi:hypothetical protein
MLERYQNTEIRENPVKKGISRRHQRLAKRLPIKTDIVEIGISEKEKNYRES